MPRVSSAPGDACSALHDGAEDIARYLEQESGPEIDYIYCQPNSKGYFIDVQGSRNRRYLLSELSGSDNNMPVVGDTGALAPLSAQELGSYVFDPKAEAEADQTLYAGFLCRGDLAVWLGREKHRKSNLILQFAIDAALGKDFLGFKFVADKALRVVLIDFESRTGSLKRRYDGIIAAMALLQSDRELLASNLKVLEVRRIRKSGRVFPKFPLPGKNAGDQKFWNDLVGAHPADLYVVDPLRTLHSADENDSSIEALLSEMQRVFRGAAVIVAHHMRKSGDNPVTLVQDMRAWSDGARGSSAIKAHSDLIVLQERTVKSNGDEVVHLGAFLKDGADIEPVSLMGTDHESFYWKTILEVPDHLCKFHEALIDAEGHSRTKRRRLPGWRR